MNRQKTGRSKAWTPDHLQLVDAAERVRFRLRRLLPKAPLELRSEIAGCCNTLTWAIKARRPCSPILDDIASQGELVGRTGDGSTRS